MSGDKIQNILNKFKKYVSKKNLAAIEEKLAVIPDTYYDRIMAIELESTTKNVILGAIFGWIGVDRFRSGNKPMGAIRCMLTGSAAAVSLLFWLRKSIDYVGMYKETLNDKEIEAFPAKLEEMGVTEVVLNEQWATRLATVAIVLVACYLGWLVYDIVKNNIDLKKQNNVEIFKNLFIIEDEIKKTGA